MSVVCFSWIKLRLGGRSLLTDFEWPKLGNLSELLEIVEGIRGVWGTPVVAAVTAEASVR